MQQENNNYKGYTLIIQIALIEVRNSLGQIEFTAS